MHPVAKLQESSESQVPITRGLSAPVRVKATKTRFMRQTSCTLLGQECQSGLKRNDEDKMVYALILRLLVCSQYKVVAKFIFFSHHLFHKIERINEGHSGFLSTTA